MPDNQGQKQASFRAISGKALDFNGDFIAAAEAEGITGGTYNEIMIKWLQFRLSSSETNLPALQQAFADSLGVYNWNSITTISGNIDSNRVAYVDSTIAASYTSGETWANVETAPADGTSQTANDFYMGVTGSTGGDEPTFTGTPGDSGAYMLYDGNDLNAFKGSITPFFDNLHKTTGGQDFTVIMAVYYVGILGFQTFASNRGDNDIGLNIYTNPSTGYLRMAQKGDTGSVFAIGSTNLTDNAWNLIGAAHKHGTNETKLWVNSATADVVSSSFNTTTSSAAGLPAIAGISDATQEVRTGTRIKSCSWYNKVLSDAEFAEVAAQLSTQHGMSYL